MMKRGTRVKIVAGIDEGHYGRVVRIYSRLAKVGVALDDKSYRLCLPGDLRVSVQP